MHRSANMAAIHGGRRPASRRAAAGGTSRRSIPRRYRTRSRRGVLVSAGGRRRPIARFTGVQAGARRQLQRYRTGSLLAIALTGLFLLLSGTSGVPAQQRPDSVGSQIGDGQPTAPDNTTPDPGESIQEATGTLRQFGVDFMDLLPKLLIALGLVVAAGMIVRVVRWTLRRVLARWERADAATAVAAVFIWILTIGVSLSVIAGDTTALLGSVGLLGLALSWALQGPIESFAGWLLNSFKGYYRVGDRIEVGEVFGDVYRIDALTTTVWEAGGPEKPVQGAQPTGCMITFPNSEVLRANIINYTRGFPYVWDEVTVQVANESDLAYAARVVGSVAQQLVGPAMAGPVAAYRSMLEGEGLAYDVSEDPQVYGTPNESWFDLTVRYLVPARERRRWASTLNLGIAREIARPEHGDRIVSAYPVQRIRISGSQG